MAAAGSRGTRVPPDGHWQQVRLADQYAHHRYMQWCDNGLIFDFVYWLDRRSYVYCAACWAWGGDRHVTGRKHVKHGGRNWACRDLSDKVTATVEALANHARDAFGLVQFGKMLLQAECLYVHEDAERSAIACLCAVTGMTREYFEKAPRYPGQVNHRRHECTLRPHSWPDSSGVSTPSGWTPQPPSGPPPKWTPSPGPPPEMSPQPPRGPPPEEMTIHMSIRRLAKVVENLQNQVDALEATNTALRMELNTVHKRVQSIESSICQA